jgi:hypothetical protein
LRSVQWYYSYDYRCIYKAHRSKSQLRDGSDDEPRTEPWLTIAESILADHLNHHFFVTAKGYFGIMKSANPLAMGDFVCTLKGSLSPFIISKCKEADRYKLVG